MVAPRWEFDLTLGEPGSETLQWVAPGLVASVLPRLSGSAIVEFATYKAQS